MATVIEPGDGRDWSEHFPEVIENEDRRKYLNTALMLLAAWMTRTNSSAKTAARRIYETWWKDIDSPSQEDLISMGWVSWYTNKIVETKPRAFRTYRT